MSTKELISSMKKAGTKRKQRIWTDIAKRLSKPRRNRAEVNIEKLSKLAEKNKGKTLVVPGKVLGNAGVENSVNVAALSYSAEAKRAIQQKGRAITLGELLEANEKPSSMIIVK